MSQVKCYYNNRRAHMKRINIAVSEKTAARFKRIQESFSSEFNRNINQDEAFKELVKRYSEVL